MNRPRLVSLLGLGFGDCGKGLFTDALCRRWQARAVVRFNGGAQAGHNVVLPDGRHHTFSQFSSGTFVPGVTTVLAAPVVVHPGALLVEHARLQSLGVNDALDRLLIDRRCRVNTLFHQAAGRLRELRRGAAAHGTCGVGVGETVRHAMQFPEHILNYGDLRRPALAMQKLEQIRRDLLMDFAEQGASEAEADEFRVLTDENLAESWLIRIMELLRRVPPASPEQISTHLACADTVLFEGAQGVLLDEWRGFHPHTTWSTIHPKAVEAVALDYGLIGPVEHLGILRSYLTRHGQGPMPTSDTTLAFLPEPHNAEDNWQGQFRRGHPDAVLLRYALAVIGQLDGLLISHLDVFGRVEGLKWCKAYRAVRQQDDAHLCVREQDGLIRSLCPSMVTNLEHQVKLTRLLNNAIPEYEPKMIKSAPELIDRLTDQAQCAVLLGSYGSSYRTVL